MKHLTFDNIASAAVILALTFVATGVMAEDAVTVQPLPSDAKPGEIYTIDKDGKPVKVDLTKYWIQSVQWDAASNSFDIGLKNDGTVVWRKKQ